tara:strand:+ start:339 stop:1031 length:693 start_codon:yes stop_codon:yes gene_type:complete
MEKLANNIWIAEGDIVDFHGFPYPTRCVIVRLASGDLWCWSPIALSPALKTAINLIGKPAHLVSPNKIHHLYLQDWQLAWPEAKLWGPASTISKRSDLAFEAPLENEPPNEWGGDIDLIWFNGSPVMDEIVFFHRPSKTAILADLSENFSDAFIRQHWKGWKRWIAKPWGIMEGKGYAPLEWRLSFLRRKATRAARDRLLAWNPRHVVMAHGEIQRENGQAFLERAFAWL